MRSHGTVSKFAYVSIFTYVSKCVHVNCRKTPSSIPKGYFFTILYKRCTKTSILSYQGLRFTILVNTNEKFAEEDENPFDLFSSLSKERNIRVVTQVNRMSKSRRVLATRGKQRSFGLHMVCFEMVLYHNEPH